MTASNETQTRTARAVRAACDAGRDLGLDVREPTVLHDAFSVIVHLAPAPVAVRIPVVVPPGMAGQLASRQQRELDVVAWLAAGRLPVVAPSPLVPLKPVAHDGFSMTFWTLAEVSAEHVPYAAVDSARVVTLHAALRDYPAGASLPFLAPVNHSVPSLLRMLVPAPDLIDADDIERAQREWDILAPALGSRSTFEARFPGAVVQAVHGDGPSYNTIHTASGIRFADFEDVNLGPIEWDLALCTPDDVERYNREAARRGLAMLDPEILQVMNAARALQMVASCALIPELPLLEQGLQPLVEAWRGMPFAGGMMEMDRREEA